MTSRRSVTYALAGILVLVCAGVLSGAGLNAVTPKEAYELIRKNAGNRDFVIIDVRTPDEYDEGHVEGAINIDYYHPGFQSDVKKLDRNKTYLLYCRTGNRSGSAFRLFEELRFQDVYHMEGGTSRWKREGLPLVKK
jgi:rhodanese-related sulfurtransferase